MGLRDYHGSWRFLVVDERDNAIEEDPAPLEMDGVLDLHMFPPDQVKPLVGDWLDECVASGLTDVRIIHGKGIGVLKTIVYSILEKRSDVESYGHPSDTGSWGATIIRLGKKAE
jgi:DNA-nicking Smr family endonuclease